MLFIYVQYKTGSLLRSWGIYLARWWASLDRRRGSRSYFYTPFTAGIIRAFLFLFFIIYICCNEPREKWCRWGRAACLSLSPAVSCTITLIYVIMLLYQTKSAWVTGCFLMSRARLWLIDTTYTSVLDLRSTDLLIDFFIFVNKAKIGMQIYCIRSVILGWNKNSFPGRALLYKL